MTELNRDINMSMMSLWIQELISPKQGCKEIQDMESIQ